MPNIGYHARLVSDNTVKTVGGSFGGSFDLATVNRLVNNHFTVEVTPSGRAVFVDRRGRRVSLYVSVDADTTEAGRAALLEYRKVELEAERKEEEKREQLRDLLDSMGIEEALKRLS